MEFSFEAVINTIFYVGSLQGIILAIFLFNVKSNKLSNRLLAILTLSWAIILLVFALQSIGLYRHYPHFLKIFFQLLFAWFPLLYLSVKYLIYSSHKFQKKDLLHFLPMLINILLNADFYVKSGAEKLELVNAESGYYYFVNIIGEEILSIQGIIYPILSLIIISNYKRNIVNYHSNIDLRVLNGFRNGIILALIAWIIGIVGTQLDRQNIDIGVDLFLFVYLTFVAIIYLLSILAIRSPEVFKLRESEVRLFSQKKEAISDVPKSEQVAGSKKIPSPQAHEFPKEDIALNEKLQAYMVDVKPYLNPELTLQQMAEQLEVTRHHLSAVINQQQKMNFYEFVNMYRINEVKALMEAEENKDQTNYDLAFDAGFNSKASFYRIFKQITKQTPSEFRAKSTGE